MFARLKITAATAIVALAGLMTPAMASFPDKDITLVVPFSPGGGFDTYARLIAPYLEKHLPNKVHVIIRNEPGAGGRKGLADVYRSKPDGYKIVIVNVPGAMLPAIIGQTVGYDLEKITWIARVSDDAYFLCVPDKSPVKTFAEFKAYAAKNKIKMPSMGAGSTIDAMTKVILGVLGINGEVVTGYKGTKETTLALMRGDTQAGILPQLSARKYIQAGEIRALLTTDDVSVYKGVPTAKSLGLDDLNGLFIHRLIAAPPGTPPSIQKILSDAFLAAMADPAAKAAAARAHRPFAPLSGEQAEAAVKKQLALFLRFKDELKK
jgi:tripartite-type tricarboxylate transporter receptor subunit TctC